MKSAALYSETQYFTQIWVRGIVLGVGLLFWYAAYRQLLIGEPWGTRPAGDLTLFLAWLLGGVALPAIFLFGHLRTEVRPDAICVRFIPFHLQDRCWRFEEIERIEALKYSPLLEYGGWGIRFGPSGLAYNVRGSNGVRFLLGSGKRILIGTQDPEGFMAAVEQARRHSHS